MSGGQAWSVCFLLVSNNVAPIPLQVDRLVELLSSRKMGVVAHFYMDPEVWGQEGVEIYRSRKMGVMALFCMVPKCFVRMGARSI